MSSEDPIIRAIIEFPMVFELRAFPQRRFGISRSRSWVDDQQRVHLWVYEILDHSEQKFGTFLVDQLRQEVVGEEV